MRTRMPQGDRRRIRLEIEARKEKDREEARQPEPETVPAGDPGSTLRE